MNEPELVILAAGIGSRFGGIKQLAKVGPNNESLIDYSIYNALKIGFRKFVMVIRKEIEKDIKEFFKGKFTEDVKIEYVYQEVEDIPESFALKENRKKPWGTVQSLIVCKNLIKGNFAMINGDDYYSFRALKKIYNFLKKLDENSKNFALVGYKLKKTLSKNGSVSRGICKIDENNNLIEIVENKDIKIFENKIISFFEEENREEILNEEDIASMNLFGFTKEVFPMLEKSFENFLEKNISSEKKELVVSTFLEEVLENKLGSVKVLPLKTRWFGITYKEDEKVVKEEIKKLIKEEVYPNSLWE